MSVESNPGLNWFCFTVLFDWSRKLAPPSQPIRCKLKPIAPWSLAFSRATGRLHAFTSSCHWLPLIISFTLIGRCDYLGFGFRHSIEKRSKLMHIYPRYSRNPTVESKCVCNRVYNFSIRKISRMPYTQFIYFFFYFHFFLITDIYNVCTR